MEYVVRGAYWRQRSQTQESKNCFLLLSLITKTQRKTEQSINGYITRRTPDITCTSTYNKQYRTRTWGEERVKYTTCIWWNWNQVCGKTRQNKWKMKSGFAMARRPVTSTAERCPNKERDRLLRKSWHRVHGGQGPDTRDITSCQICWSCISQYCKALVVMAKCKNKNKTLSRTHDRTQAHTHSFVLRSSWGPKNWFPSKILFSLTPNPNLNPEPNLKPQIPNLNPKTIPNLSVTLIVSLTLNPL